MSTQTVIERAARRARFLLHRSLCPTVLALIGLSATPCSAESPNESGGTQLVASFRMVVTGDTLEDWQRCREFQGRMRQPGSRAAEDLAVEMALAGRHTSLDADPLQVMLRGLAVEQAAADRLKAAVASTATPSTEEVRRAWEETPTAFDQPRRWRLSNITLKTGREGDGAVTKRRSELEAIRLRIEAGEDFGDLARRYSESATAHRGGAMGFVTLDRVRPEVAAAIRGLGPGDLSPVIETDGGVVLLLCGGVTDAVKPTFDEIEPRLRTEIKSRSFTRQWEALATRLQTGLKTSIRPTAAGGLGHGDPVVADYRLGGEPGVITLAQIEAFLRRRGIPERFIELDESRRLDVVTERLDLMVQARESRRRGLFDAADAVLLESCLLRARRAQLTVNRLAMGLVDAPTDQEIERAFLSNQDRFFEPRRLRVEALRLPLDRLQSTTTVQTFEAFAADLQTDRAMWNDAASMVPELEVLSWGWMTEKQLWLRGPGVEQAMRGVEVDGVSPVVQEGRQLFVFKLLDEHALRRLSLAEVSPGIRASLLAARRKTAGRQIRSEIIDQIQLELAPELENGAVLPPKTMNEEVEP
jgi:PPIC-type PPIASE domain